MVYIIKKLVNRTDSKMLHVLASLYKYYQRPKYKEIIQGFNNANDSYCIKHLGDKNIGSVIFDINIDDPCMGLWGLWKNTVVGVSIASDYGFVPFVRWTKEGPYYSPEIFGKDVNPYDYFFNQPSRITIDEMQQSRNVARFWIGDKSYHFQISNNYENDFNAIDSYISYSHMIVVKEELQRQIQKEISRLFQNMSTIGVHVRGVEWGKIKNHPIPVSLDRYYELLEEGIQKFGFTQIFLATDSEEVVLEFRKRYTNVLFFEDVVRTPVGRKELFIFDNDKKTDGYRMGYEIIRDTYALAECGGFVGGYSNVSLAALTLKEASGENYIFKGFIKNAINKRGISGKKAVLRDKGA